MSRFRFGVALLGLAPVVAALFAFRHEELRPVSIGRFESRRWAGSGDAIVLRRGDGRHVIRFSRFATHRGPDVRVYLVGAPDVANTDQLKAAGFLDLGALRVTVGDQSYEIPRGIDVTRYRAVAIWCRRAGVNFMTASLALVHESMGRVPRRHQPSPRRSTCAKCHWG